jgi:hypothetical protein
MGIEIQISAKVGANLSFILFFFLDCRQPISVGIVYYNYKYFLLMIFLCVYHNYKYFQTSCI